MTTTVTKSFQFRLTGVDGTPFNTRTRQNIKKPIGRILYLEEPPTSAVKLAYVGSREITPTNNMFIGDRSDELYANSKTSTSVEFSVDSGTSTLASSNFLVTAEFTEASSGSIPLYYKHEVTKYFVPNTFKVLDQNFNEVGSDKYKLVTNYSYDEDDGSIELDVNSNPVIDSFYLFNSLENSFDIDTGEYTVYFVQYIDGSGSSETLVTEILNNEPAYLPATFDDYWTVTSDLKPWCHAYSLSSDLVLKMPIAPYSVKYIETNRMSVHLPTDYDDESPWFPRIANGSFADRSYGEAYKYEIKEFENQAFNPIEPYKLTAREKCYKISDRLVKLPHEEIVYGATTSYVELLFELDEVVKYATTNNPSKDGDIVYNFDGDKVVASEGTFLTWSYDSFLGVDRQSGIVHVGFDVKDSYDIYGTYSYSEKYYTLTSLTMNPVFDSDAHKELRVVYVVPSGTPNNNATTQSESIRWLKVSSAGRITSCNQDDVGYNENINFDTKIHDSDGYYIDGVLGLHYSWSATTTADAQSPATEVEVIPGHEFTVLSTSSFPRSGWLRALDTTDKYRYFKYSSKTDTAFRLSSSSDEVPTDSPIDISDGNTVELVNFINERTTLTSRDKSTEDGAWGPGTDPWGNFEVYPRIYSRYFVLGELSINPPHSSDTLTVIDVREDGGGIDEDKYDEAKALNPEVQWYNDYEKFDGQVYPGSSVAVIKLPVSILDSFTLDNIREIVNQNIPVGVYPLIRFYGYEPRIVSITPGTASVTIEWAKEGPEFTYQVWYARKENGRFEKAHVTRIVDGSSTYNSFEICAVTGTAPVVVKVTMQDKYYQWWHSYSSYNSIEGGLGLDEEAPTPPFNNVGNFQFEVV